MIINYDGKFRYTDWMLYFVLIFFRKLCVMSWKSMFDFQFGGMNSGWQGKGRRWQGEIYLWIYGPPRKRRYVYDTWHTNFRVGVIIKNRSICYTVYTTCSPCKKLQYTWDFCLSIACLDSFLLHALIPIACETSWVTGHVLQRVKVAYASSQS